MNQLEITDQFIEACSRGDMNTLQSILTNVSFTNFSHILDSALLSAVKFGHLNVIEHFFYDLDHNETKGQILREHGLNVFKQSLRHEHSAIARSLLFSGKTYENLLIPEEYVHNLWIHACEKGLLDFVQYLLTSPQLAHHADIHFMGDIGLQHSLTFSHFDVASYLLTSPELTEHANIHIHDDKFFKAFLVSQNLSLLNYLIFDYQIELTESIKSAIKSSPHIQKMFSSRELTKRLHSELTHHSEIHHKPKI